MFDKVLIMCLSGIAFHLFHLYLKLMKLERNVDKARDKYFKHFNDYSKEDHKRLVDKLYCTPIRSRASNHSYYCFKYREACNELSRFERKHKLFMNMFNVESDEEVLPMNGAVISNE